MSDYDVFVTITIHATAARVWQVLTEPDLISRWMMGSRVDSGWRQGDTITWSGEYNGTRYEDKGSVLEVAPGERLVHTHFSPSSGAEDKPENYHHLVWTIADGGETTTLTLTQSGAHSPSQAEGFRKNWLHMLELLRDVAEGPDPDA